MDDLVGAAEIASRLGVAHASLVHDWRARYSGLSGASGTTTAALVWAWPDVEAWARKTGRTK